MRALKFEGVPQLGRSGEKLQRAVESAFANPSNFDPLDRDIEKVRRIVRRRMKRFSKLKLVNAAQSGST